LGLKLAYPEASKAYAMPQPLTGLLVLDFTTLLPGAMRHYQPRFEFLSR